MAKNNCLIENLYKLYNAMKINTLTRFVLFSLLVTCLSCSQAQNTSNSSSAFNPSTLQELGDSIHYGSYIIYKIGDGVYKICDPGTPGTLGAGLVGVDMYVICGDDKALMFDLGNNYLDGYEKNLIEPRENAKEELLSLVYGLTGDLPLEIVVSHAASDHSGMTRAFLGSEVPLWIGEGEDMTRLKTFHNLDPSVFQIFKQGDKTFNLGGGRTIETFLVRGHSNGGTVLLLKPDMMFFTADAISPGPRRKRELHTAEEFNHFTEDINKLVAYLKNNLSPYERYGLQVYTGHSAEMIFHLTKTDVADNMLEDALYGEWRFVQDMANVANGIKDGSWLDETNGFHHFEVAPGPDGEKQIQIVYYLGALILPESVVYEVSGMKVD